MTALGARSRLSPIGLGIMLICVFIVSLWRASGIDPLTQSFENRLLDLRFVLRGERPVDARFTIVAIDEHAVNTIGMAAPMRSALARAMGVIAAAGPRVVALDLLFLDITSADHELARMLARVDPLVLAVAATNQPAEIAAPQTPELDSALDRSAFSVVLERPGSHPPASRRHVLLPLPGLAQTGHLAHVNIERSADGGARRLPTALRMAPDAYLPALPVRVAGAALGIAWTDVALFAGSHLDLGPRALQIDAHDRIVINHAAGTAKQRIVPLTKLLTDPNPDAYLSDRIVFIGSTAESLSDYFSTPFSPATSGVEVLATATQNLIAGNEIIRNMTTVALSVLLAGASATALYAGAGIRRRDLWLAAAASVWIATLAGLHLAFEVERLWLDAMTVIPALVIGSAAAVGRRLSLLDRSRARIQSERTNLSRYVHPALADLLASTERLAFDRRMQTATVLFVDVAGFTSRMEQVDPIAVAGFLSDLHCFYEDTTSSHSGLVVDYQGDGAVIVFGLPDPTIDDARSALACATALLSETDRIRSDLFAGSSPPLRVSVHTGPVAAAVLGGQFGQVTVAGDTVNVASRLQEVAKIEAVPLVVTSAVLVAAGIDPLDRATAFRPLKQEATRGRSEVLDLYTLKSA
ncbi:MAG: adenylate/guanylate cyclase domain-containing protein [Pseudomonadota bacterium]